MANDKKFIVKNGLLTEEDVLIGSTTDTGERLQVTGTAKFSGAVEASQSTLATPTVTFTNDGGTGGAVIASFVGDSDSLRILNVGVGDYKITNDGQDNGFILYDDTAGVEVVYNGNVDLDFNSTGIDFKREPSYNGNVFWNAGNDGSGSGLDADVLDGIDSLQFLRSDVDDTFTGSTLTIDGDQIITGNLTIQGTTTSINTEQVLIADNIITLNSNFTSGNPTESAGWEVLRGDESISSLRWDESNDYFKLISDGTDLGRIITTADEGANNGFDADTVDGLHGYQFLRSDANDTATGDLVLEGTVTIGNNVGGAYLYFDGSGANRILYSDAGDIGFLNSALNYAAKSDVNDNWIVTANTVAKSFVDADDSTYYGDFAGTSVINNIALEGNLSHNGDADTYITFSAADTVSVFAGNSEVFNFNSTTNESLIDLEAPKFLDSGDNTYFALPSGASVFKELGIDTNLFHNGNTDTKITFGTDQITFDTDGVIRLTIDNNSSTFSGDVKAAIYYDSDDDTYYLDPASGSRLYDISLVNRIIADGDTNTYLQFTAADTFSIVTGGSARLTATNSAVTAGVNVVAPKFVDGDNNSYFVDPSANSVMSSIGIDDYISHNNDDDTYIGFDANDQFAVFTGGTKQLNITNTAATFTQDTSAPTFFGGKFVDSDDNTYFLDPRAGSGPSMVVNSQIQGADGTASIPGFSFENGANTGMYRSAANVLGFTQGGLNRFLVGFASGAANYSLIDLRAPRFVDSDDVNYLGDFAGTSVMNNIDLEGKINHKDDDADNTYIQFPANDTFEVVTGGTQRLQIDNTGATFSVPVSASSVTIDDYIYHAGDVNTYMGFSAEDTIVLATGGTARLTAANNSITTAVSLGINQDPTAPLSVKKITSMGANPFVDDNLLADFSDADGTLLSIRGSSNENVFFVAEGDGDFYFYDKDATAKAAILDTGEVIVNGDASLYADSDNTPVIGNKTNNKLHVAGSVQLNSNDDAYVVGRAATGVATASSFFKNNELGFGEGGGFYMDETTTIKVRGDKKLSANNEIVGTRFVDYDDDTYYLDPSITTISLNAAGSVRAGSGTLASPSFAFSADPDTGMYRSAANVLGFAAGGNEEMNIYTTYVDVLGQIRTNKFVDRDNVGYYLEPQGVANGWRVKTPSGYIDLGPRDVLQASIETDRPQFAFNKKLVVDEGIVQSLDEDLFLRRATSTTARIRINDGTTFSDQNLTVRGGTVSTNPPVLRIEAKTSATTSPGNIYGQLQFNVAGSTGVTASGIINTNVNTVGMITAEDFRSGATTNEDSGLGFYTALSGGTLRFNGGISSSGAWYVGNHRGTGTRGSLHATEYVHGQRFVDADNSNYYVDPAADSQMNTIDIDDYIRHRGDLNTYIGFSAADTFKIFTGGTERVNIDNDSADFAQNIYAPQYFDSDDNTYKGNFAGFSVMKGINFGVPGNGNNVKGRFITIEGNTDATGEASSRIFFAEHNSTNASKSNFGMSLGYRGGATTIAGGDGNTWEGLDLIGNGEWAMWGHDNNAKGNWAMKGPRSSAYVEARGAFHAPIFKDSGDTNYYGDFAGTSVMNRIDIDDYIRHKGDTNTYFGFEANDTFRVWTAGTRRLNIDSNSADFAVNVYAPRYYDSNDNDFYADPASKSIFKTLELRNDAASANDFIALTIQNGNATGDISTPESFIEFRFDDSNATFEPQGRVGFRAGQNNIMGQDDSNSIDKEGSGTFVVQTSNGTGGAGAGVIRDTFQVNYQGDSESLRYSSATRFRDRDNTAYYLDPASTSITNTMRANRYQVDGSTYFIDTASGTYGSIRVSGNKNGWAGYAINDDWVFMADGAANAGIYNDTDNKWALLARRNAEVELYYNTAIEAETGGGYFLANNESRAPIFKDSNATSYYAHFGAGNLETAININGRINRTDFATGDVLTNKYLVAQDRNHWVWTPANNWGIFWATTTSSLSHFGSTNPNELIFAGSGTTRASIDLDNGNAYFQGQLSAGDYALSGGNEALSLSPFYTRGYADETLFDGTMYWEKRVIKAMRGAENNTTGTTSEYVKSSNAPGSSSYVLRTSGYRNFYSDYIEVEPGEELYGEMSVRVISGSGGRLYYGVERFDKDKKPIAGNTGTTYFVAGGTITTSTSWQTFRGYTTLPTSHTVYNGSDGGGCRYVRIRILYNYNSGGALREFTAPILKRSNYRGRLRGDDIIVSGDIDATGNVTANRFRDRDNTGYYTEPAATSIMATIDANIFRARGDTGYFLDPNADHSMRVYGEISSSNYQNGNMQPGALNIGRTDRDYDFSAGTWSSDIRAGIMANFSETWEMVGHDSGDAVKSFLFYDGTDDLYIGRNIGWSTTRVRTPGNIYSPVFYDNDDDSYYGNFAGESIMQRIILKPTAAYNSSSDQPASLFIGDTTSQTNGWLTEGRRPNITVKGQYPQINIMSSRVNNTTHGPTLRFSAYDTANASTGNKKHWVIGTSGTNATKLSFGYQANQDNPHYGVGTGWGGSDDRAIFYIQNNRHVYAENTMYANRFTDRSATSYWTEPGDRSYLNTLTLGSYDQNSPIQGKWYSTGTYAYSASLGTRYYWIRLCNANTSAGKAIIEYQAKDDVNYSGNAMGRIVFSSWNNSTISVDHFMTGPSNSVTPQVRIDNDRWLWIRLEGNTWDSFFRYRFMYASNISNMGNNFRQEAAPSNSTNNILAGQQFKGTQGNLAGGNPSYTNYVVGDNTGNYSNFYRHRDRDNTAYYMEPAGNSQINELTTVGDVNIRNGSSLRLYSATNNNNRGYFKVTDTNDEHLAIGTSNGEDIKFYDGNENGDDWNMIIRGDGQALVRNRIDSPIFYDRDDPTYYGNFAGTSITNTIDNRGEIYNDGWFRSDTSGRGLYSTPNAMHWYSDTNNRWRLYSTQTTAKILFTTNGNNARGYVYANDSNDIGFRNQSDSWALRTRSGTTEVYGDIYANRYYGRGNSNYYTDPNETSQMYRIAAEGLYERNSQAVFPFVGGGEYRTTSSSTTGQIQIKLPTARNGGSTMLHFTVHIYEYNTNRMTSWRIGGYAYSSRRWTRCSATQMSGGTSPDSRMTVRFYRDDGENRHIVSIGETGDTWSYVQVTISDVHTGYSGRDGPGWSRGWNITIDDEAPASLQQTITPSYYLNTNNYNLWPTNLDAYLFRDRDSTSYHTEPAEISEMSEIRLDSLMRHRGDTNSYLYFVAADDLQLVAGGRQVLRMDEGTNPDRTRFATDSNWTDSNGDWNVSRNMDIAGDLQVTSWVSATEFRDVDDTNYKANPAGTSRLNTVQANDLQSSGDVQAYVNYSDIRWKENVRKIENAVDKVQTLDGIIFNYIDRDDGEYTGVIAQQVEKVLPGIVTDRKDMKTGKERKSVRYGNMVGLLIEATKEQQETINKQQQEIDTLKELVYNLMEKLDK